jgi:hypothetical protein
VESSSCLAASVSFVAFPASSSTSSVLVAPALASASLSSSVVADSMSTFSLVLFYVSLIRFVLLPIVAPAIVPQFHRRLDILPSFGRVHAAGVPYVQCVLPIQRSPAP